MVAVIRPAHTDVNIRGLHGDGDGRNPAESVANQPVWVRIVSEPAGMEVKVDRLSIIVL